MMMTLIEISEYDDDNDVDRNDVVDRVVKVLLLLKFEDEYYMLKMMKKLSMIYRCITLMMILMIPSFSYCCCF